MATKAQKQEEVVTEEAVVAEKEVKKNARAKKTAPKEETPAVEAERTILFESEMQMKAVERKVLPVFPGADVVVIENIMGGDLFVAESNVEFTPDNVISPGESKEFHDVKMLSAGSYSRPIFKVSHYKK